MTTVDLAALPADLDDHRSSGWWGMVVVVASEATLFAALLAAYLYLRVNADRWPVPPAGPPDLVLPAIGTALLVASSVTLVVAERARRRGDRTWTRAGAAATTLLGLGFLVVLVLEFRGRDFGIDTNAYGSVIYALTGLHGAHVVAGLVLLLFAQWRMWTTPVAAGRVVAPISLYWHFVDVVWVVLFCTLYLSEHLW